MPRRQNRTLVLFRRQPLAGALGRVVFAFAAIFLISPAAKASPLLSMENDLLRIAFDPQTGGLESAVHKPSGLELRTLRNGAWRLLWTFSIVKPDGSVEITDNQRTLGFDSAISSDPQRGAVLTLTWRGLTTDRGTQYPNAVVQVTATLAPGSAPCVLHWSADNVKGLVLKDLSFPYVSGVGPLGGSASDNRLLWPQEEGRLFHDPYGRLTQYGGASGPSALMNMQFIAYYNSTAGFLLSSRDVGGYVKGAFWSRTGNAVGDVGFGLVHAFDETEKSSLDLPYDVTLGAFSGGWTAAADVYKAWAYQQWWVKQAGTKHTAAWLPATGVGTDFCTYKCGDGGADRPYSQYTQHLLEANQFFQMPVLGMLWGWERYGAWYSGDYFPPSEGWSSFDQTMAAVHGAGNRSYLFITPELLETSTSLWQSGALQAAAVLDRNGQVPTTTDNQGHRWAYMDLTAPQWQDHIVDAGVTLASHAVDLIQLDGLPWTPPFACYNPSHGHPLGGGGNWRSRAVIDFLIRFRQAVLVAKPDAVISGEGGLESYLPWLDMVHSRDNWYEVTDPDQSKLGAEVVPLLEYVYHPWMVFLGEHNLGLPSDDTATYHRLAVARTLVWGQIPDYNWWQPIDSPAADAPGFQFLRDVARARTGFAKDFLVNGAMLAPLELASPDVAVKWQLTTGQFDSSTFPAIQHGAWRAPDGRVGIVLTNISGQSIQVALPIRPVDLGLSPATRFAVSVLDGTGSRTIASDVSGNASYLLDVPPLKVLLVVVSSPIVGFGRTSLSFAAVSSGAAFTSQTPPQTVRLTQMSGALVPWTATTSSPWLLVSPASGSGPATLTISTRFAPGLSASQTGSVTLTFTGAGNVPDPIGVALTVKSSTAAPSPAFGAFDTPVGDSTVLAGSIAVTGWALDDMGVSRVEIWRDLQAGETTPPFTSTPSDPRNGKVFISTATFVDGARPDVEALYPSTPFSSRAGWGYLLLTWGLWNQGNGTYRLLAFAFDQEGGVATIGTKTIVVSNNAATKPFGSIDTPAIGGDPGTTPNFGWGLTPLVNGTATCRIPSNGVQVSIDSGPLQPVVYGDARTDIAGAFPGFSNSAAAGGHFIVDWSTLTSGAHTIGWLITDDCNRADGVGSRFFTVTAGTNLVAGETLSAAPAVLRVASPASAPPSESDAPITVAKGYGELPLVVDPGLAGSRTIELTQGERIEVRLPHGYDTAYQIGPGGQSRALPAGATWDRDSGIFYWQPAAGFLGRYRLVFTNGRERISVRVYVSP